MPSGPREVLLRDSISCQPIVIMASMGGPELAAMLLARRRGMRVLLVSGCASEVLDLRGVLAAGTEFLQ